MTLRIANFSTEAEKLHKDTVIAICKNALIGEEKIVGKVACDGTMNTEEQEIPLHLKTSYGESVKDKEIAITKCTL